MTQYLKKSRHPLLTPFPVRPESREHSVIEILIIIWRLARLGFDYSI